MRVEANGVEFECLSEGTGPLVLLLHGFPDTAHSWNDVRPALAQAGYRAVSPFMRGYHPTSPGRDGRYDSETLGRDALALIDALGEKSAIVIGHDWGASAAYAAASLDPNKVRVLVTLAIPHPAAVTPTLALIWRCRHMVLFKLPGAAGRLRSSEFALLDELVRRWSPTWKATPAETELVKTCLREPGSAEAAIAYYQQLSTSIPKPLRDKIKVPTISFAGETDGVLLDLAPYEASKRFFEGSYEVVRMPGGHFLHREHPEEFKRALLDVLRRHAPI